MEKKLGLSQGHPTTKARDPPIQGLFYCRFIFVISPKQPAAIHKKGSKISPIRRVDPPTRDDFVHINRLLYFNFQLQSAP